MDIFDQHDRRALLREFLQEPRPRSVQPLARSERMETLGDVEAERQAEVAKATKPLERDVRAIVLTEIEVFAQHLGQRPVRDAVTVRETAAGPLQWLRLLLREPSPQLTHEPSLPNTRVAGDRNQQGPALGHGPLVRPAESIELGL